MKVKKINLSIYDYKDYRCFLKRWYELNKKQRRSFSYRSFASNAGFSSPNTLKRVIDGQRRLTMESATAFARAMKLNKQEALYFRFLVQYQQAKTHQEKNLYYKKILQIQKVKQLKPLAKDQYDYCSQWYHPVVRELLVSKKFKGDLDWIAKNIQPELSLKEVEKSVQLLERLGLVLKKEKKNSKGDLVYTWVQGQSVLSTGPEALSLLSHNYHQEILSLIKDRLDDIPSEQRELRGITLGISAEKLPLLINKIREIKDDILSLVSDEEDVDQVMLLAIQLIPVSK